MHLVIIASLYKFNKNINWTLSNVRGITEILTDSISQLKSFPPTPHAPAVHDTLFLGVHSLPPSKSLQLVILQSLNEIDSTTIKTKFRYRSQITKNIIKLLANYLVCIWLRKYFSGWYISYWDLFQSVIKGRRRKSKIVSSIYFKRLLRKLIHLDLRYI
jgi:hypothetical protein